MSASCAFPSFVLRRKYFPFHPMHTTSLHIQEEIDLEEDLHPRTPRDGSESFVEEEADVETPERPEKIDPDTVFDGWFGSADATSIRFHGEIARQSDGRTELLVDGRPLSTLLDAEDRTHYEEVFLPHLLQGSAVWRGETLRDGTALEGCVAVRRGMLVELTYGLQATQESLASAEQTIETRAAADGTETQETAPPPRVIDLDRVFDLTAYPPEHTDVGPS